MDAQVRAFLEEIVAASPFNRLPEVFGAALWLRRNRVNSRSQRW